MSISSIGSGSGGWQAFKPPTLDGPGSSSSIGGSANSTGGASQVGGSGFAKALDSVQQLQDDADTAATQVATGQSTDLHQMTIASAKASLGVSMTVAFRNKAVEAYQEIMRMQV
jgi:flagellar hook-basal body complex protein FliE